MNEGCCDTKDCTYCHEGKCIHSWYCIIGLDVCTSYTITHLAPEELYKNIFKEEEKEC